MHDELTYPDLPERFWSKVDISGGPDACWLWTAGTVKGYGQFSLDGQSKAHRVMAAAAGLDMSGHIHHVCGEPLCQNPRHMEAMTAADHCRHHEAWRFVRGAHQLAKTHCPQGHPYSGENLYVNPAGARCCRECFRQHHNRYNREKRERLQRPA